MQLFGTFGKLKNIRLPLKMRSSSEHRGFFFTEFVTKEDAKRALMIVYAIRLICMGVE